MHIHPKCCSLQGNIEVKIDIDLDEKLLSYMEEEITIGFISPQALMVKPHILYFHFPDL